jgi:succinate dehydrogenase/fumarate reductase flavoprotein subunit
VDSFDLLVLGGGMAGLTAAARAAQAGATVAVVEKGPSTGGSAISAEFLWSAPSLESIREAVPDGDPKLAARLVERRPEALGWIEELGIPTGPEVELLGFGVGNRIDMAALLRALEREVRDAPGCEVLLSSEPVQLLLASDRVVGAEIRLPGGEISELRARSTLLAMGGFAGSDELRRRHLHPNAAAIPLRANPRSDGRALALGRQAGGAFGAPDAGFYGHLMPAGITVADPARFATMTFFHSEHGVLINRSGQRFVDETEGDHLSTLATLEQPGGMALLICDERVHREWMLRPYVEGLEAPDKFDLAYRAGARCATAADLDEFADLPDEWGYPGPAVRDTLIEFNASCAAAGAPSPPRRRDPHGLTDPPYYVLEVTPAITFTFGGLLIDPEARVLREDGDPIRGLLAAGADAGGLYVRAYAGGIAAAMVFGMCATETALAEMSAGPPRQVKEQP